MTYPRPTPDLLRGRSDLRYEEGGDTEVPKQVGKGGVVLCSWEAADRKLMPVKSGSLGPITAG